MHTQDPTPLRTETRRVLFGTPPQGSVYFPTLTSVDVSAHVKTEPVLTYSIARVRICLGLYLHTLRSGGASAAAVHTPLALHRSGASGVNFCRAFGAAAEMIFVSAYPPKKCRQASILQCAWFTGQNRA